MSTNKVNLLEQVKGYLIGTQAAIEASPALEGYIGYATDTNKPGSFNGSSWTWGQGGTAVWGAISGDIADQTDLIAQFETIVNSLENHTLNENNPHATTAAQVGAIPLDGWIPVSAVWTRTGNHTYTTPGNVTATYRKGTRIRYQDGGGSNEHGAILSSSHAGGTTTINLLPNSDFAMAAATITNRYISYLDNPEGWPKEFNFAVGWNNLTVGNGTQKATYRLDSNGEIFGHIGLTWGSGTSITAGLNPYFNLPAPSASYEREEQIGFGKFYDSSLSTTVVGAVQWAGGSNFYPIYYIASTTPATMGVLSNTVPYTWAVSDQIVVNFQYFT